MPSAPFPEHPDSSKLFARNGVIDAVLPLSRLERLGQCLHDTQGQVAVHLVFGHDAQGRRKLEGELSTQVTLQCQRCLQTMVLTLSGRLDFLVVDDEATRDELEESGPSPVDVIVDEEDDLDMLALVEDELLLSLPMVPMHTEQDCNAILSRLNREAGAVQDEKANPFAVLATLKQESHQGKNKGKGKSKGKSKGKQ